MKKSKIQISPRILDAIADAHMSEQEKLHCLRYIGYLTAGEQQELYHTLI